MTLMIVSGEWWQGKPVWSSFKKEQGKRRWRGCVYDLFEDFSCEESREKGMVASREGYISVKDRKYTECLHAARNDPVRNNVLEAMRRSGTQGKSESTGFTWENWQFIHGTEGKENLEHV